MSHIMSTLRKYLVLILSTFVICSTTFGQEYTITAQELAEIEKFVDDADKQISSLESVIEKRDEEILNLEQANELLSCENERIKREKTSAFVIAGVSVAVSVTSVAVLLCNIFKR